MLSDGSLWKTTNGGVTITSLASDLNNDKFHSMQQAADGSVVYLLTTSTWMWVSEDGATTFSNRSMSYYVYSMVPHPTDPTMVLYLGWTPCCLKSLACTTCKALLLGSDDKGNSWTTITDYAYYRGTLSYDWSPVATSEIGASIAYIAYADKSGDQRVKLGEAMNLHLVSDFRNASSSYTVIANGGPFYQTNNTYMMARVSTGRPGLSTVAVSRNYGQTFTTVHFPPISSFNTHREWLPTESGNPFLGSYDGPEYSSGHVFVSPGGTKPYTLSLDRAISRHSKAHWTHIGAAIPGTYIANAHPTVDGLSVATVISYDHGGIWHPLMLADASSSDQNSRVHLSAPYPGPKFHAPTYAPGLIVAAGQVGPLLTSWEGDRVLVSRDAGRTWTSSLNGTFVVYGANGGTLIMATDDSGAYSTALNYSLDFGASWSQCNFAPFPVRVVSMRPNNDDHFSPIVIMDAKLANGSYALITMNFTGIYNRTCTSNDFTNWRLTGASGEKCIFGMERIYARRAVKSMCQKMNGQARVVASERCECTKEDFFCPYCYARNDKGDCDFMWDACSEDTSVRPDSPTNCNGTYELDDPEDTVVLSADSTCEDGMEDDDFSGIISCPPIAGADVAPVPISTLQGSVGVTVAAIAVALCGMVIVGLYYGARNFFIADNKEELIHAWKHAPRAPSDKDSHRDTVKRKIEYSVSDDNANTSSLGTVDLEASHERYSPSPLLVQMGTVTNSDSDEYSPMDR